MEGLLDDLGNFIEQMEAVDSYINSIDEIMGSTFQLKVILNEEEQSILDSFNLLNLMYIEMKENEARFIDNLKNINEKSNGRLFNELGKPEEGAPDELLKKLLKMISSEERGVLFELSEDDSISLSLKDSKMRSKIEIYLEESRKRTRQRHLLFETSLITISNAFESLHSKLISFIIVNSSSSKINDKQLSFEQIIELSSLEEAKEYLIEKSVEDVMRGSQITWLKYIGKNTFKEFFKELVDEDEEKFKEFFLRRNLIIHNNAVINKRYLNSIKKISDEKKAFLVGKKISVSLEYLEENMNIIFLISIKSVFYVVKKFFPTQFNIFFKKFHNIAFNYLKSEKYEIAYSVFDMLWKDASKIDASNKLLLTVNYLQSLKWTGNLKRMEQIRKSEDFSLAKNEHLMCLALIDDNFKVAIDILEKLIAETSQSGKDDVALVNEYLTWPIFKEFIETTELNEFLKSKGYIEIKNQKEII
ncbi:TPA: hypothetical protein IV128_002873, partial [Enterococcus faecium]|nr:hypothetical protein [Enterococcus faecium]